MSSIMIRFYFPYCVKHVFKGLKTFRRFRRINTITNRGSYWRSEFSFSKMDSKYFHYINRRCNKTVVFH